MSTGTTASLNVLKPSDFATDQDVRWCPGCGDYSILAQTKKVLAKMGVDRSKTVFISGIGCSSRFPYYMNTYGFHSIHGRAPTFATGLKLARPDLDVWVVTGDGDGLSIGGNHLMHLLRRNVNLKVLLFNNRIYGLTKGQYSPTSEVGKKTKSSPMGSADAPIRPLSLAIAAEATFVARSVDVDVKHLEMVLERAAKHQGTAFVEIYQNCNIFNDGAYSYATDKATKSDHIVYLEQGKPLLFGTGGQRAIRLKGLTPEIVAADQFAPGDLLTHDEFAEEPSLAYMLSRFRYPEFPEPMGIFRDVQRGLYEQLVRDQVDAARQKNQATLQSAIAGDETWTVK